MFILEQQPSIGRHFIAELRDKEVQKDSMRFRRNMERVGEILAYEISKTLPYQPAEVETPLGIASTHTITQMPVLATILRAGLPLYQGLLNYFDKAESAFVAAYRGVHNEDHSFEINMDYLASPSLEGKILILADPMLATGRSLVKAYESLLRYGKPAHTHVAVAIASTEGVAYLNETLTDFTLWVGALDTTLNDKAYIIPGLGDAGDLAFGAKI
jgi:uracil phosphoribosyltransferase